MSDVKCTIIGRDYNRKLAKLIQLYKQNPQTARVFFFQNGVNFFQSKTIILFERADGSFEICEKIKTFGISVTNRMYSRDVKTRSIIYTNKNRFYIKIMGGKSLTQLTYKGLEGFIAYIGTQYRQDILSYIETRFPYIKMIGEYPELQATAFNTYLIHNITGYNDALRHFFKVPVNVAKMFVANTNCYNPTNKLRMWKETLKQLTNVQSLRAEMVAHHEFIDACKMARTLGKKINCTWGLKRFSDEHAAWAAEIRGTIGKTEETYELNISDIYKLFAKMSKFRMLETNTDMWSEGQRNNHCVGTYSVYVENGTCAIYDVEGYTLQIGFTRGIGLVNMQFRGYKNCDPPVDLVNRVSEVLLKFNTSVDMMQFDYRGNQKEGSYSIASNTPKKDPFDIEAYEDVYDNQPF